MARSFKEIQDDIRNVACDIYVGGLPSDTTVDVMSAKHRFFAQLHEINRLARELGLFGNLSTDHLEEFR